MVTKKDSNNNKIMNRSSSLDSFVPFFAGGIAGINEIVITYPLEYLKTTLQLQQYFQSGSDSSRKSISSISKGISSTKSLKETRPTQTQNLGSHLPRTSFQTLPSLLKYTYEQKGMIGFYQGLSPWLLFAFPRSAIRFSTFEATKTLFLKNVNDGKKLEEKSVDLSPIQAMIAGSIAGAMEWAIVGTPMQCLQIRLSHDSYTKKRFEGKIGNAISSIVREDGIWKGLYAGIGPTVLKGLVNNCIRFSTMQELKKYYESNYRTKSSSEEAFNMTETMLMGCLAGGISAFCTHPIDTVKSNVQLLGEKGAGTSFNCLKYLIKEKGFLFLYKGFLPRFIRVSLEIGFHFTLYDKYSEVIRKYLVE